MAVLSCDNQTGEASYDRLRFVVTDALTTKLEQFKDLRVTTQDRLLRLAKRAKLATVDTVDNIAVVGPELGLELCAMEGIEAAILPRITKVENLFVTHVQVVDVKTSRRIAGASAQGLGVESILSSQIDQVVLSIALRLGLGPGEDEPVPPRLADISTSSLEAYSDYLLAGEMAGQFLLHDARLYLLKAIEHDSTFALAHSALGGVEGKLGNSAAAKEAFQKARELSYRATEKEQLSIQGEAILWEEDFSHSALEENVRIQRTILRKHPEDELALYRLAWSLRELERDDEAIEVLHKLVDVNPENTGALNQLGWIYSLRKKEFEKAIQYFRSNERINPRPAGAVGAIGAVLFMMGRMDEALATMKRSYALDAKYTTGLNIGYLYALREDYSGGYGWVESQVAHAGSPSLKALGYLWKGYMDFWCGRLESAEASVQVCKAMAENVGDRKLSARAEWLRGWIELERGSYKRARACFESWRTILSPREPCRGLSLYTDGLMDLYQGRKDSARARIAGLEEHVADGLSREREVEHSLLGLLIKEQLLRDGSAEVAASHPVSIPRFETLVPPTIIRPFGPGDRGPLLSVVYMRTRDVTARAHAALGDIAKAIQEYESLVAPDTTRKLWIPPRYYYRLARLYDREGSREKADATYEKFLNLWRTGGMDRKREEWKDAARRLRNLNVEG
jgi:tetratricopeptide (TPR) repeat protein